MRYGPDDTTDEELIRVAGTNWAVEKCFQTAKNVVGLVGLPRFDGHPRSVKAFVKQWLG